MEHKSYPDRDQSLPRERNRKNKSARNGGRRRRRKKQLTTSFRVSSLRLVFSSVAFCVWSFDFCFPIISLSITQITTAFPIFGAEATLLLPYFPLFSFPPCRNAQGSPPILIEHTTAPSPAKRLPTLLHSVVTSLRIPQSLR